MKLSNMGTGKKKTIDRTPTHKRDTILEVLIRRTRNALHRLVTGGTVNPVQHPSLFMLIRSKRYYILYKQSSAVTTLKVLSFT